jgi:hypothetical protein
MPPVVVSDVIALAVAAAMPLVAWRRTGAERADRAVPGRGRVSRRDLTLLLATSPGFGAWAALLGTLAPYAPLPVVDVLRDTAFVGVAAVWSFALARWPPIYNPIYSMLDAPVFFLPLRLKVPLVKVFWGLVGLALTGMFLFALGAGVRAGPYAIGPATVALCGTACSVFMYSYAGIELMIWPDDDPWPWEDWPVWDHAARIAVVAAFAAAGLFIAAKLGLF